MVDVIHVNCMLHSVQHCPVKGVRDGSEQNASYKNAAFISVFLYKIFILLQVSKQFTLNTSAIDPSISHKNSSFWAAIQKMFGI